MYQEVKQTHKEKMRMYMKLHKRHLAEMLIECNKHLDILNGESKSSYKTKNKLNTISVFIGIIIGALLTIGTLILIAL